MKFNALYSDYTKSEFEQEMGARWSGIFGKLYGHIKMKQQKRRLKNLLKNLKEQRDILHNLIIIVENLLEDSENPQEEQPDIANDFSKTYMHLIDTMFSYISIGVSSLTNEITLTSVEFDESIPTSEILSLITYKTWFSVKEDINSHKHEGQSLEHANCINNISFISVDPIQCKKENIYTNIYYYVLIQEYFSLYHAALDNNLVDLHSLNPYRKRMKTQDYEVEVEYVSKLKSQLFCSSLSKYIFTWRFHNHITQVELAKRSGVDRTMISKIEKLQQTASLETTIKLLSTTNASLIILPEEPFNEKYEDL